MLAFQKGVDTMRTDLKKIRVEPGTELALVLAEAATAPVLLEKDGELFRLSRSRRISLPTMTLSARSLLSEPRREAGRISIQRPLKSLSTAHARKVLALLTAHELSDR